jgi:hypothetical protein
MPPDGNKYFLSCFITFLCKCLDCLMIFNIELPFSLNKTRIGNRTDLDPDPDPGGQKKHGSGSIYSFSTDILYHSSSGWGFPENFSRKTFAKYWRNFAKTVTPFVKVFVFAIGQKSVFVPTLIWTITLENTVHELVYLEICVCLCDWQSWHKLGIL